jgi:hypothetical protein
MSEMQKVSDIFKSNLNYYQRVTLKKLSQKNIFLGFVFFHPTQIQTLKTQKTQNPTQHSTQIKRFFWVGKLKKKTNFKG